MITVKELNSCLKALGAIFSNVQYIEVAYGHTDYLDNICDAFGLGLYAGPVGSDACYGGGANAMMYPSHCSQGWLGDMCNNGCGYDNYDAFDCHAPR